MIIISDATPLIGLARINSLNLLQSLFSTLTIPQAVYNEVVIDGAGRPGMQEVAAADWIQVVPVKNRRAVNRLVTVELIHQGESEAIVLAQELKANYVILDDENARGVARKKHLPVIGTVGILLLAKEQGLITDIRPLLDALISAKMFVHRRLYQEALKRAGES